MTDKGIRGRADLIPVSRRIGVYAGAFDPVHSGHITFAMQALSLANLDQIIFMPERRPRQKPGVEHYAHRIAMITRALQPHPALAVMEMVDKHYSVQRTLPRLKALFPGARLVLLMGSDAASNLPDWPHAERVLGSCGLVVGVRSEHQHSAVSEAISEWDHQPQGLTIIDSFAPDVSSSRIRQALRTDTPTDGLLASVRRYARSEWLYVSPSNIPAAELI
jgi:nicotinate-nucleotide adenylyltransferase